MATIKRAAVAFLAAVAVALPGSKAGAGTEALERFTAEQSPWFNSVPLTAPLLRGKVVLVNFWTYSCINSLRALPYMEAWAAKYKGSGLVVIGVHTPEFSFEKDPGNVATAVRELRVTYPVVMDSDYGIWQAFDNEYWPALYLIDASGRVRYHFFGEGAYDQTERVITRLLKETGVAASGSSATSVVGTGVEAPAGNDQQSPETYVGYHRAEQFASPERVAPNAPRRYTSPARLSLNQWALIGAWNVGPESGRLQEAAGKIAFHFHSRDLHLVLGPAEKGRAVRFKVTVDGAAPGADHGSDSAPDGSGEVREPRLYQLIRQQGPIRDRTFEVEFLDPGVRAYVFTFG